MLKICRKIDEVEKRRITISDSICIHFESDNAYINGLKFIDKRSLQLIVILQILLRKQAESRLAGAKDTGCTWMQLATEIDLRKQKRKNKSQTSEQHIRQLISQLRKKAKEITRDDDLNFIDEATKGRYALNRKIVLF